MACNIIVDSYPESNHDSVLLIYEVFMAGVWESGTSGDLGLYSFSAHCFASACTASGEEKYAHAHNIAERVMHYLNTRDWNANPHKCYSIGDVYDLQARESEPKSGARKVCRVIVEGTMLVKRKS